MLSIYLYEWIDTGRQEQEKKYRYGDVISHNLVPMAKEANIYDCIWKPLSNGFFKANQIIDKIDDALGNIILDNNRFEKLSCFQDRGGTYQEFKEFLFRYLKACHDFPEAFIEVK